MADDEVGLAVLVLQRRPELPHFDAADTVEPLHPGPVVCAEVCTVKV